MQDDISDERYKQTLDDVSEVLRDVVHDILRQKAGHGSNRGARYRARRGPAIR